MDDRPAWSPDSRQLAYVRDGQLWLADGASGNSRQLALDVPPDRHLLLRHPNGQALLGRGNGGELWLVPAPDGDVRRLALLQGRGLPIVLQRQEATWSWSPDS